MSAEIAKTLDAPEVKDGLARLGLSNAYLRIPSSVRAEKQSSGKVAHEAKIRME